MNGRMCLYYRLISGIFIQTCQPRLKRCVIMAKTILPRFCVIVNFVWYPRLKLIQEFNRLFKTQYFFRNRHSHFGILLNSFSEVKPQRYLGILVQNMSVIAMCNKICCSDYFQVMFWATYRNKIDFLIVINRFTLLDMISIVQGQPCDGSRLRTSLIVVSNLTKNQ